MGFFSMFAFSLYLCNCKITVFPSINKSRQEGKIRPPVYYR